MRVCNLSSGSDGNITYIETDSAKVLVDIGLSCAEVCKRLKLLDVEPNEIDAILITHEHSDHIKGLDMFASKYKTKVYVHEKGMGAVYAKMNKLPAMQMYAFGDFPFAIKDLYSQMSNIGKNNPEYAVLKDEYWAARFAKVAAGNREYSAYMSAFMVASDPIV